MALLKCYEAEYMKQINFRSEELTIQIILHLNLKLYRWYFHGKSLLNLKITYQFH